MYTMFFVNYFSMKLMKIFLKSITEKKYKQNKGKDTK